MIWQGKCKKREGEKRRRRRDRRERKNQDRKYRVRKIGGRIETKKGENLESTSSQLDKTFVVRSSQLTLVGTDDVRGAVLSTALWLVPLTPLELI